MYSYIFEYIYVYACYIASTNMYIYVYMYIACINMVCVRKLAENSICIYTLTDMYVYIFLGHMCIWVMSYIWMGQLIDMNESCRTYE